MKKKMDKLKVLFNVNKKSITFMTIIFIIALISGSIFSIILSSNDKLYVSNYLKEFYDNVLNNKINISAQFNNVIVSNIIYITIMWIIGVSIIGFPLVITLFFIKSFIMGFTVGSILTCYQLNGIIMSLIYLFPHNIINIVIYYLVSIYAITLSKKILYAFFKRKNIDFKNIFGRYLLILTISIFVMIICALYEVFLVPHIIKSLKFLVK